MVKGENYSAQLYENWSNRLVFNTLLGGKCGIIQGFDNELEVTASASNVVVDSGVVVVKGGIIRNTTALTLPVTLANNQYCIVVVEVDLTKTNTDNTFNQGSIKVLSQTGSYPTLTQNDIENTPTSGVYQFEIARFTTSSSAIGTISDTREFLNYEALIGELQQAIDDVIQGELTASDVGYSNSGSGLNATNVQSAIDELSGYLDQLNQI